MTNNVWDSGRWSFVARVSIDFMTKYIMEHMLSCVSLENKTVLELGAGTGRLSYLALKQKAKKVTLVDSSKKAISLSQQLFSGQTSDSYEIVESNVFDFSPQTKYDLVFSSGLVEHFKDEDRLSIIRKHVEWAIQNCIIVHPTDSLYSRCFNRLPLSVKLYGFQKSFSDKEMNGYIGSLVNMKRFSHVRFQPFYTVPFLHNNEVLNRLLDRTACGRKFGGLTLTHIEVSNTGDAS